MAWSQAAIDGYVLAVVTTGRGPSAASAVSEKDRIRGAVRSWAALPADARGEAMRRLAGGLRPTVAVLPGSVRARALLAPLLSSSLRAVAAPSPLPRHGYAAAPRLREVVYRCAARGARRLPPHHAPHSGADGDLEARWDVLITRLAAITDVGSDRTRAALRAGFDGSDTDSLDPHVRAGRELRELAESSCLA
jgi:hypothetical protein